jgi:hypothetical protein
MDSVDPGEALQRSYLEETAPEPGLDKGGHDAIAGSMRRAGITASEYTGRVGETCCKSRADWAQAPELIRQLKGSRGFRI